MEKPEDIDTNPNDQNALGSEIEPEPEAPSKSASVDYNSDATFTSTEQSLLPEKECNLPPYIHKCLRGHDQAVICLAMHPVHSDLVVSGGMDDRVLFWSLSDERILGEMNLEETITQVAFSADGKFLGVGVMGGKFASFELVPVDSEHAQIGDDRLVLKASSFQVVFV